jgi:RNA polymerase sigma factor (TIGR02999 family)
VPDPTAQQVTRCLRRLQAGEAGAADELLPLVYDELRGIAAFLMRSARDGHTLQPTALVHEAWLKVQKALDGGSSLNDRNHFLSVASTAMRQVLVNHARDKKTEKRGGGQQRLPLDECLDAIQAETGDLGEWNELLVLLARDHERPVRVVEMRVFAGMTIEEVATALGISPATVKVDWRFARAWLQKASEGRGLGDRGAG